MHSTSPTQNSSISPVHAECIEELPDEMLVSIFELLSLKDLAKVSLVNRRFQILSLDVQPRTFAYCFKEPQSWSVELREYEARHLKFWHAQDDQVMLFSRDHMFALTLYQEHHARFKQKNIFYADKNKALLKIDYNNVTLIEKNSASERKMRYGHICCAINTYLINDERLLFIDDMGYVKEGNLTTNETSCLFTVTKEENELQFVPGKVMSGSIDICSAAYHERTLILHTVTSLRVQDGFTCLYRGPLEDDEFHPVMTWKMLPFCNASFFEQTGLIPVRTPQGMINFMGIDSGELEIKWQWQTNGMPFQFLVEDLSHFSEKTGFPIMRTTKQGKEIVLIDVTDGAEKRRIPASKLKECEFAAIVGPKLMAADKETIYWFSLTNPESCTQIDRKGVFLDNRIIDFHWTQERMLFLLESSSTPRSILRKYEIAALKIENEIVTEKISAPVVTVKPKKYCKTVWKIMFYISIVGIGIMIGVAIQRGVAGYRPQVFLCAALCVFTFFGTLFFAYKGYTKELAACNPCCQ